MVGLSRMCWWLMDLVTWLHTNWVWLTSDDVWICMISVLQGHDVKFRVQMMLINREPVNRDSGFQGCIGDLYFSAVKRRLGIKDYSRVLSSHGPVGRFGKFLFLFAGTRKSLLFLFPMDSCCGMPFPMALANIHEAAFLTESIPSCLLPMHWFGRRTHQAFQFLFIDLSPPCVHAVCYAFFALRLPHVCRN